MNGSTNTPGGHILARQGNVLVGFTVDRAPPDYFAGGIGYANPAALGTAVTYGCVDWFDYENHPQPPECKPVAKPIR